MDNLNKLNFKIYNKTNNPIPIIKKFSEFKDLYKYPCVPYKEEKKSITLSDIFASEDIDFSKFSS